MNHVLWGYSHVLRTWSAAVANIERWLDHGDAHSIRNEFMLNGLGNRSG